MIPQLASTTKGTSVTVPINLTVAKGTDEQHVRRQHRHATPARRRICSRTPWTWPGWRASRIRRAQDAVELGRAEPDVLQLQRAAERRELPRRSADQRQLHAVAAGPEPSAPLRRGVPARQLVEPEQRQRARHVHVHGPLHEQRRADFARRPARTSPTSCSGMPQQATLQVGGLTTLAAERVCRVSRRQLAAQQPDDVQPRPALRSAVPVCRRRTDTMANLDVTPDFTAAAVVLPGQTGPVSRASRSRPALVNTDWNNIGPRVGMAYRLARGTVLNTSYSITYNTSSYSSIAQRARRPAAVFGHGDERRLDRRPAVDRHGAARRRRRRRPTTSASIRSTASA